MFRRINKHVLLPSFSVKFHVCLLSDESKPERKSSSQTTSGKTKGETVFAASIVIKIVNRREVFNERRRAFVCWDQWKSDGRKKSLEIYFTVFFMLLCLQLFEQNSTRSFSWHIFFVIVWMANSYFTRRDARCETGWGNSQSWADLC